MKVTLDHTNIIDLEQNNKWAPHIRALISMNGKGDINLRIVAISASEHRPNEKYSFFSEFQERINNIGLSNTEVLKPILYWGMGYWDYCVYDGGELSELERKIQRILFPNIETLFSDYCATRKLKLDDAKAWRTCKNVKCDVLSLWSHIWYNGDIFVTRDGNFFKQTKKPQLLALGAGAIIKPD